MNALLIIDRLVAVLTGVLNFIGAGQIVSDIVAKRIAEGGRDWTDDERKAVADDLAANKAYAAKQLGIDLPDPNQPPTP